MIRTSILLCLPVLAVLAGCGKSGDSGSGSSSGSNSTSTGGSTASGSGPSAPPPLYAQNDTPDNLKGLLDTIMKSSEAGDHKKAATLIRALLPDKAALSKACRDDAPAGFIEDALKGSQSIPADDAQVSGLFKRGGADRTEIRVHGATTEEILANAQGSVAFKEFPGGARKLAEQVLRPAVKFYEVEFAAPGSEMGMKYHMFFFDGSAWRMLGPAWRALK